MADFLPDLPEEDEPKPIGPQAELAAFGRWRASTWIVPAESLIAYKRIVWDGSVVAASTGKPIDVSYYFEAAMPIVEMRAARSVQEEHEAEAWAQMNEWVGRTARGTAFVAPVALLEVVGENVLEEIERWEDLKPDDWRDRIVRRLRLAEQETTGRMRMLAALGADPESPLNTAAGWAVAVVPWDGVAVRRRGEDTNHRRPTAPPGG